MVIRLANETLLFDFTDIQSMIVNAKSTVELYHDDQLWRIRVSPDRSILKYVELYGAYKEGRLGLLAKEESL